MPLIRIKSVSKNHKRKNIIRSVILWQIWKYFWINKNEAIEKNVIK